MDEEKPSVSEIEIKFKPVKKKNLRKRVKEEDSDDEEYILAKLEEAKEIQKLRERPNGVSVIALATGQKASVEDEVACKDPFKVKSGGMVNMQALKSGKVKQVDDAYDTGIGTQFSAETNKRDEDEEMMKYIEEKLLKRKGEIIRLAKHYELAESMSIVEKPTSSCGLQQAVDEDVNNNNPCMVILICLVVLG